jgi:ATP-binding cassette subfamily F protein 3
VLILDEPTNHLDMDSKELLMRAMDAFTGTVLFVSHDRYFVENIATRVILVKGGRVTDYPGDYQYYLDKLSSDDRYGTADASGAKPKSPGKAAVTAGSKPAAPTRLADANAPKAPNAAANDKAVPASVAAGRDDAGTGGKAPAAPGTAGPMDWEAKKEAEKQKRKAEKRWSEIEAAISGLDQKVATLDAELCLPDTYSDQALSTRLAREKREAEESLSALYKELEQLEADGYGG